MRWRARLLLPALAAIACWLFEPRSEAAPAGRPGPILLLSGGGDGEAERRLLGALRIATRDLGCEVITARGAPREPSVGELGRAEARGRAAGAAMVVWLGQRGGVATLFALRTQGGVVQRTEVGGDDAEGASRTAALKLRALYTSPEAGRSPEWTRLPVTAPLPPANAPHPAAAKVALDDDAAPAPQPPARPTAPTVAPPDAGPSPTPPAAPTETKTPGGRRAAGQLSLAVGYALALPLATGPGATLRHGLGAQLGWAPARAPMLLLLDVGWRTAGTRTVTVRQLALWELPDESVRVDLWEVPLGLSLLAHGARGRLAGGLGPRLALNLFRGEAVADDGRRGSALGVSVGIGLRAEGRVRLWGPLWLAAGAGVEWLLPGRRLLTDGLAAVETGSAQLSAWAGPLLTIE